jgi:hypothetical protein
VRARLVSTPCHQVCQPLQRSNFHISVDSTRQQVVASCWLLFWAWPVYSLLLHSPTDCSSQSSGNDALLLQLTVTIIHGVVITTMGAGARDKAVQLLRLTRASPSGARPWAASTTMGAKVGMLEGKMLGVIPVTLETTIDAAADQFFARYAVEWEPGQLCEVLQLSRGHAFFPGLACKMLDFSTRRKSDAVLALASCTTLAPEILGRPLCAAARSRAPAPRPGGCPYPAEAAARRGSAVRCSGCILLRVWQQVRPWLPALQRLAGRQHRQLD